ncbi:hypothetical protein [Nocardia sp. NPDC004260]
MYLPIENKNIRDWVYPRSAEPYQLLRKAALLQRDAPEANIMPVLVCRHTLRFLAQRLGFKVHDTTPDSSTSDPSSPTTTSPKPTQNSAFWTS